MKAEEKVDDTKIKAVFEYIHYLVLSGAVMASGVAVSKHQSLIFNNHPTVAIIAALLITFTGFLLALWAIDYGYRTIINIFPRRSVRLVAGLVLQVFSILALIMVMAIFFSGGGA